MSPSRACAPVVRPVALWVVLRTAVFAAVSLSAAHPAAPLVPLASLTGSPALAVALAAVAGAVFLAAACVLAGRLAGPRACLPALAAADVALTAWHLGGGSPVAPVAAAALLAAGSLAPRIVAFTMRIPTLPILLFSLAALAASELSRADRDRPYAVMSSEIRRAHLAAHGVEPRTVGGDPAVAAALSLHGLTVAAHSADVVVWESEGESDPTPLPGVDDSVVGRPFVLRVGNTTRRVGWLVRAPRGLAVGAGRSENLP